MSAPVLLEVDPETLEGMERPIPRAGLTAGRSRDNLLVIDGLRASRRQFSITSDGKQWWLQDLKSAAGTLLNGRKLGLREALAHQDVVSLPNARDPWWLPFWKPVWGHPRVALGGLVISGLAAALVLWPSAETTKAAMAAPVQVQDVSTTDPSRSVMVYSNPDDDVTVIWVFNPMEPDEQS